MDVYIPQSKDEIWGPKRLTRYERARIVSARTLQLSLGAPSFLDLSNVKVSDPIEIANLELDKGVLPLTIARKLPGKGKQLIPVSWLIELEKKTKPT